MKDTVQQLKQELESLVIEGDTLYKERLLKEGFADMANLRTRYQDWYSKCLPVIRQLLPDRIKEFENLYRLENRKEIHAATYTISDYLQLLTRPPYIDDPNNIFLTKLDIQVRILSSALSRIDSILADAKGALRADLLDTELHRARELSKNGYIRAAGIIAGVVLESHLAAMCNNHQIKLSKAKVTLSDYNDVLKKAGLYDTADWQKIQWFASVRNLCAHAGQREPTSDDIESLIAGVDQVTKLIH